MNAPPLGGDFFNPDLGQTPTGYDGRVARADPRGRSERAGRAGEPLKRDSFIHCEEGLKRERNSLLDCEDVLGLSANPECRE